MKAKKKKQSEFLLKMIRPLTCIWMWFDTTTRKTTEVPFDRKEPFVLLGNHVYMFDVVSISCSWKNSPTIVASEFLLNMMMPDVIQEHVSFGFTRDIGEQNISFAIIKGFKKTVTGFNVMDNAQFMDLTAENLLFEVAVEF